MQPLVQLLCHHLPQRHARAQAHGVTHHAALAGTFGELRNRLRRLVLHELAHVAADHAHADLLVHDLLDRKSVV